MKKVTDRLMIILFEIDLTLSVYEWESNNTTILLVRFCCNFKIIQFNSVHPFTLYLITTLLCTLTQLITCTLSLYLFSVLTFVLVGFDLKFWLPRQLLKPITASHHYYAITSLHSAYLSPSGPLILHYSTTF